MNETLEKLGQELRRYFAPALRRPMNWHMIDALVKIEEIEEAQLQSADSHEVQKPLVPKATTSEREKTVPWKGPA